MYTKVLVPLDGSELAECALIQVKRLAAEGSIGSIILFNVVEVDIPFHYVHTDEAMVAQEFDFQSLWEHLRDKSEKYLTGIASRLASEGVKAEPLVVRGGKAASMIAEYASQGGIDLIVIATHGYSGMKKLVMGSVAMQVLHDVDVPVLLVKPASCTA